MIRITVGVLLAAIVSGTFLGCATPGDGDAPAHDSSKWEGAIKAFEEADEKQPPQKGGVLFIGSSSIRMWKTLGEDFPRHHVINRGFGGSEIADSIAFADRIVFPYKPKTIFLYAGDNDIARGKTPRQVYNDFREFAERVHERLPETEIGFIAIKPSIKRRHLMDSMAEANELIRLYSRYRSRIHYVDIFTPMLDKTGEPIEELFIKDGLHLSREGYRLWTSVVEPRLPRPTKRR